MSKIGPDGSALEYSTFFGGTDFDYGTAIKVDAQGSAYVIGTYGGSSGFLTRLDPTGTAVLYSALVGGWVYPSALAVGPCGVVYMGGATFSQNFPIVRAFQPRFGGGVDGFILRVSDTDCAFRMSNVSVREGDRGTRAAVFTVSLPKAQAATVTVDYGTADGTAGAPADYTATSGTLTFAPGVTSRSISVPVVGDTTFEDDETFFVRLSRAVNAAILSEPAHATILNDDPPPRLSINDVSLEEGDSGTRGARFTVSLSAPSEKAVVVRYATLNETAVAPGDYRAVSGTLTFAPGVTSQDLTVYVNGDTFVEKDETFLVRLGRAAGAVISKREGRATVRNDDPAPPPATGRGLGSRQHVGYEVESPRVFRLPEPEERLFAHRGAAVGAGHSDERGTPSLSFVPFVRASAWSFWPPSFGRPISTSSSSTWRELPAGPPPISAIAVAEAHLHSEQGTLTDRMDLTRG